MIYGYIRVSTDKQTVENQRFEINNYCAQQHMAIDKWCEETISGATRFDKRSLGKLLKQLKSGDTLISSELSRLGRSLYMVMEILNQLAQKGVTLHTIKDNFTLDDSISSKVIAFAFALSAEIERNLISQRTREALARVKSEGKILGRPCGTKNKTYKLSGKEEAIQQLIQSHISLSKIAILFKVHRNTLNRFLKNRGLK